MPADLDELFAALGSYTDRVPVGPPELARRRGQRRTRRRLAASALAVMLVIGSVVVIATRFQRPDLPPTPTTPTPSAAPVRFTELQPLGAGVDMELGGYGMAAVVGDRAYVGARTVDGRLHVNAIDLRTGDPLWSTVDLGSFGDWNGLLAGPQAVVVIGEHDDGTIPDHVLMVLDPDTGAKRWETGFDDLDIQWYDIGAVLPSRTSVRALDWRTGAELWRIPVPDTNPEPAFLQNFSTADAATAPAMLRVGLDPTDHRFFMVEPSGRLHRYDAATGLEQEVVPDAGPAVATREGLLINYRLVDDQLFSTNDDRTEAYRYDLRNPAGLVRIYTATGQDRIDSVTACGPERACVITRSSGPSDKLNLVDLSSGRILWQVEINYAEYAVAAGDWIITERGNLVEATTGRRFDQRSTVFGGWVTPSAVLIFTADTEDPARMPQTVVGVSTLDGSSVTLGQIGPIAGLCAWSTTVLVCPTLQAFRAWRFAT
ncbi:MAG: PQQ-binding-like beta-propeller repeat protein [Micromonosporaceae bacterium]|nr:PQQ-binding-like beta-propeller repeat protein [Micromonosporaceae bacterium]